MFKVLFTAVVVVTIGFASPAFAQTEPTPPDPGLVQIPVDGDGTEGDGTQNTATQELCERGLFVGDRSVCGNSGESETGLIRLINNIFGGLIAITGAIAVIIIIVAGMRFVFSGGDPQAIQGARNSIIYAAIALVVLVFTQVIINFVLTRV